ncbi:MAG: hypothetical protein GY866_14430 [Proteobacteria bacterium]|nr:hypothetical protein [Pseudomonadota bacterium]
MKHSSNNRIMKNWTALLRRILWTMTVLYSATLVVFSIGCAPSKDELKTAPPTHELRIVNKSQFEFHHVFIHGEEQNYKEAESLISQPLPIDQSVSLTLDEGSYMVTVTHLKNKDGPLLAYSTAYALGITRSVELECFDDSFRLSDLEVNADFYHPMVIDEVRDDNPLAIY